MTNLNPTQQMPTSRGAQRHAPEAILRYSHDFQAINQWFQAHLPPYNFQDILQFNSLYRRAYPSLSRDEKRRVEEFVDAMIEGVEERGLVSKIFGVV